jgi:hypothetical protein
MLGNGQLLFFIGGVAVGTLFSPAILKIVHVVLDLLGHKHPAATPAPMPMPVPTVFVPQGQNMQQGVAVPASAPRAPSPTAGG